MKRYYLIGFAVLVFFACTKEDFSLDHPSLEKRGLEIRNQEAVLTDAAIQSDRWETFLLSVDGAEWIVADAFPKSEELQEGRVLVVPSIPLLPQGAIKRIESVRKEGRQYNLTVVDASL